MRVLEPERRSSLPLVLGLVLALEAACLGLAWLLGRPLFSGLAARLGTSSSLVLALAVYTAIAVYALPPGFGAGLLVPGLAGGLRAGRQPGAEPQPVRQP